jgi:hypothetical protein
MSATQPSEKLSINNKPPKFWGVLFSSEYLGENFPGDWGESYLLPPVSRSDDPSTGPITRRIGMSIHTNRYLKKGFITEENLTDGFYIDPYTERSVYFVVRNGNKNATVREISCDKTGLASLPTLEHFNCDPRLIAETAGVNRLNVLSRNEVIEISGLSAAPVSNGIESHDDLEIKIKKSDTLDAVPALYGEMLRAAVEKGHRLWVSNMETGLMQVISGMIGEEHLITIGKSKEYMGPATTPVAINPRSVIESIFTVKEGEPAHMPYYRDYLRMILKGVNVDKVPKKFRKMLDENQVETERSSILQRTKQKKAELAVQALIFGYSAARAIPGASVDDFHGSDRLFIGGDLVTSVTYTKGMWMFYAGRTMKEKAIGAALAGPSFIAPYAYYYAEGKDYPASVNIVAGTLATIGLAAEVIRRKSAKKTEAKIKQEKDPSHTNAVN